LKARIEALEKKINKSMGHSEFPAPGFFSKHPNVEMEIEQWRADLLRQGYALEAVKMTPAYIEECF